MAICVLLAGCRGNGGSSMMPSVGESKGLGSATFTIAVPPAQKGAARSMQSVTVALLQVDGKASDAVKPMTMNLTPETSGCTLANDGTLNCLARISVPAGNDTFTVTTYAQAGAKGSQVSADRVQTAISAGRSTSCVKKSGSGNATMSTVQRTVKN